MKGTYIDGYLFVVPKGRVVAYKKMATLGKKLWMKYGALDYKECMGDDLNPKGAMPGIKQLLFPQVIKAKKGETVWFSFVVFKSRKHRDEVNAKVMEEMNKQMEGNKDMSTPFDMKRMAYGGFQVEVEG